MFSLLISKLLIDAEIMARGWLFRNARSRDSNTTRSDISPAQLPERPNTPVLDSAYADGFEPPTTPLGRTNAYGHPNSE